MRGTVNVTTYDPRNDGRQYRHPGTDSEGIARAYLATYGKPMPAGWDQRVPAPSVPVR